MSFYALRYVAGTPLPERKHVHTLGQWATFDDAERVRQSSPVSHLLEVVVRGEDR